MIHPNNPLLLKWEAIIGKVELGVCGKSFGLGVKNVTAIHNLLLKTHQYMNTNT